MDVIKEIIDKSAAGALDRGLRALVLSIFASIVCTLFGMLIVLLRYGSEMNIQFGY